MFVRKGSPWWGEGRVLICFLFQQISFLNDVFMKKRAILVFNSIIKKRCRLFFWSSNLVINAASLPLCRSFISRATCQAELGRIHKTQKTNNNKKRSQQYLCDEKKDSANFRFSRMFGIFFLALIQHVPLLTREEEHFLIQSVTSAVLTQIRQSHKYLLHFLPT